MPKPGTRIADMLGLPRDVMLAMPRIQMLGDQQLSIENHSGVLEYTSETIRLLTTTGKLTVEGSKLRIRFIGPKDIQVFGRISSIGFETSAQGGGGA